MPLLPLSPHEASLIIPPMSDDEYQTLKADIATNGQLEPILLLDDQILDGRHRYRACMELGIEPIVEPLVGDIDSPVDYVLSLNLHRRHLSPSQRAAVAVEADAMQDAAGMAKQRQKAGQSKGAKTPKTGKKSFVAILPQSLSPAPKSRDSVAELFDVSSRYIQDAKAIRAAAPELLEQVKAGTKTIPQAKRELSGKQPSRGKPFYALFTADIGKVNSTLNAIRDRYGNGGAMLASDEWKKLPRGDVDLFVKSVRELTDAFVNLSREIKDYKLRTKHGD